MDKSKIKRLLITLIAVFIIIYVVLVFISSVFDMSGIKTEVAIEMTAADSLHKEAIILRDEVLVKNEKSGVISYAVSDGDQVSKGQKIANIYNSEDDALTNQKLDIIDNEINRLKKLNVTAKNGDFGIDTINSQIDNAITNMNTSVADKNFSAAQTYSDNLSYLITERFLVTGRAVDISSRIATLTAESNSLKTDSSNIMASVKAKRAGCFVVSTDGYENIFDYNKIMDMNATQFNKIIDAKPKKVSDDVVGKVISGVNWYIVCSITSEEALSITTNSAESVTVNIPYASTESLPATIVAINEDSNSDNSIMILKCDYMNADLAKIRKENVEICLDFYKGIRVSKSALHNNKVKAEVEDKDGNTKVEEKTVQGVYVLYGNELQFKEVSVIYSGSDFVICDPAPDEGILFTGETISLYDNIVTQGSDLKDGKIIS